MSSNIRSFFRSNHSSSSKELNIKNKLEDYLPSNPLLRDVNEWIINMNRQQNSLNASCCGGNEKKNAIKNQIKAPRLNNEPAEPTKQHHDEKIEHVVQQQAVKADIHNDFFEKNELTKAILDKLAERAITRPMNTFNDDPPRLCTKKHVCNYVD